MNTSQVQFRFGLAGFGEIGSTVAVGLRKAGLGSISAYDKYAFDGPFSRLI
jgi:phosphoglycerate dehydrogenase-like enzyme